MSSAGQIVGGVIGGVVGTVTPVGTFLGAQLGMMLGGYIDPPPGPTTEGPRLTDNTVQTSTYGAAIPDLKGVDAVHGNIFWLQGNKIDETPIKKKTGGKGSPSTTSITWNVTATFALGLCKGPIVGVRRIWIQGALYYDAASSDTGTIIASNSAQVGFRVYTGTDTQLPDPRIEADLGVGNTPAWRGRAYIVFYDLNLNEYGRSLVGTQIKVEVVESGATEDQEFLSPAPEENWYGGLRYDGTNFFALGTSSTVMTGGPHYASGTGKLAYSPDGVSWTVVTDLMGYNWVDIHYNGVVYLAVAASYGGTAKVAYASNLAGPWTIVTAPLGAGMDWRSIIRGPGLDLLLIQGVYSALTVDGINWTTSNLGFRNANSNCPGVHNGNVYCVALSDGATSNLQTSPDGLTWQLRSTPDAFSFLKGGCANGTTMVFVGSRASDGLNCATISYDDGATWSSQYLLPTPTESYYSISHNGQEYCLVPINDIAPLNWFTSTDAINWVTHTRSHATLQYGGACWDGAYWNVLDLARNTEPYFAKLRHSVLVPGTTDLGTIVSSFCLKSNLLTAGDIDVTDLTPTVRGYTSAVGGPIRNSLEPLAMAYPFVVRQRGYKLEFLLLGAEAVDTINADDLDARSSGNEPGVRITASREMELLLPKRVIVRCKSVEREYEVGEQYSERPGAGAVSEMVYDIPVVLTADECAGKAQVLMQMRWLERFDVSFNLPATYSRLEVCDVVNLPTDEGVIKVRLTGINYTSDNRLECVGKYANPAVYTATAVGVAPAVTGQSTLSPPGLSMLVLLDIPMVHATQADPSILAAMYGQKSNWQGGLLIRTDDAGTTWTDVQAFASPGGTAGSALTTISSVDNRVWDTSSMLRVRLDNGDIYSATRLSVMNGSNHFAYGVHGRWEIIGVATCTLVSADTYELRDMLRGRFGSEWTMGMHQAGDRLVLLSEADVTAIGMSLSTIGVGRTYRAVTLDQDLSTATDVPFTYTGVNLKPYAPVYLSGAREVGGYNWNFRWIRRSRTDGEWRDGVDVALGESSEAYELNVYSSGSFTTVVRTISTSTQSAVYTQAQQVTDFGSAQNTVYVGVVQLSATVGRGYQTTRTLVAAGGFTFYSNVVLQLPMTGVNNSVVLTADKGTVPTLVGDTKVSTSQGLFGSSAYFDGSGDYLSLSSTTDFNLGGGPMTIEFWVYRETHLSDASVLMFGANGSAASSQLSMRADGAIWFFPAVVSPASGISTSASAYTLNTWVHVAVVLETTTMFAIYVDGVQKVRGAGGAFPSQGYPLSVGGNSSMDLKGNIRNIRITTGVARYTGSFSPLTSPYAGDSSDQYWDYVTLFMPFTAVSGLTDTKGKSVTVNGNTLVSTARDPFWSSVYFDGAGDTLTVPGSADFAFGTGDFCIEVFAYIKGNSTPDAAGYRVATLAGNYYDGTLFSSGFILLISGNTSTTGVGVEFHYSNGTSWTGVVTATLSVSQLAWHHIAVTRAGGVARIFVDGVLLATAANSTNMTSTNKLYVGGVSVDSGYPRYLFGYMGPVRITKGAAVYTSSFTPPSAPFPTF